MDAGVDQPPPGANTEGARRGWFATKPVEGASAAELPEEGIHGVDLRFMWDYGVSIPLWDSHELLPEDPDWLATTLGISEQLITALAHWGADMERLDHLRPIPEPEYVAATRVLEVQARDLVSRLSQELDGRYNIVYVPW